MKRFISPCSPLSNISPDSRSAILFTTLFYAVLLPPCLSPSAKIFTTSGNANNNAISRRSRYFVSIDEKNLTSFPWWMNIYIYIDNIFISRLNSKQWFVRLHLSDFGFVKENRLRIFVVPRHIYTSIPLLYVANGIFVYTIPTNNGCYMLILESQYEERILKFWMIQ